LTTNFDHSEAISTALQFFFLTLSHDEMSPEFTNAMVLAIAVSSAAGLLFALSLVLVPVFFVIIDVCDSSKCMCVNMKLMDHGLVTVIDADGVFDLPGVGLHFMWVNCPVFFYKISEKTPQGFIQEKYRIYVPRFFAGAKRSILSWFRVTEGAMSIQLESLRAGDWSTRLDAIVLPNPTKIQETSVRLITTTFRTKGNASVLLTGVPGAGKSQLAAYLAKELRGAVLRGFNPTIKGLGIVRLINQMSPSKESPLVVLMNEFDTAISQATKNEDSKTDTICLAQSKTTLLDMLDYLNQVEGLILVATTNVKISQLPYAYVRPGRFNQHFEFNDTLIKTDL